MSPLDLSHTLESKISHGSPSSTETTDNTVRGEIALPQPSSFVSLAAISSDITQQGEAAISKHEVGVVFLTGGVATRMGGVVKALTEAVDGKTFLNIKLAQVEQARARYSARIPVFLMTSFATDSLVREAIKGRDDVHAFEQFHASRFKLDGTHFVEPDDSVSRSPTGHGDLAHALQRAGLLSSFRASGGNYLFISNIDNVGANLDPRIVGLHIAKNRELTCEVVDKLAGDAGGTPAVVDGKLQIVEAFRFPPSFDHRTIPYFSTNTFVASATALEASHPLTWFQVKKRVRDTDVIQFERLFGELTAHVDTTYVVVPRSGAQSRFLPVKDHDERVRRADEIRAVIARG